MSDIHIAVIGAGVRGLAYAKHVTASGKASVVAVADPEPGRRQKLIGAVGAPIQEFTDWRDLVGRERIADAVVIATQDADHRDAAVALIELGYHVLLEKPMATTESDAADIVEAAERAGVLLAVCHVMRHTPYTRTLRQVLSSGILGDVVSIEHLEPVGWWHQAHSYVRGHWRREADSAPMLLTKSVHDIDWLNHVVGLEPQWVSSMGGLYHFRPEQKPDGATDNCLSCPLEPTCPYSAPRLYLGCLGDPAKERWPLTPVTDARTPAGVVAALRDGPYGRCVYSCDNDVVDHQVVSIQYENSVTASFTMVAFSPSESRQTRIFGTHGSLRGDGRQLHLTDFRNDNRHAIDTQAAGSATAGGGHGGGDRGLIDAFLASIRIGKPTAALGTPRESLASHRLAWAAERSRTTNTMLHLAG